MLGVCWQCWLTNAMPGRRLLTTPSDDKHPAGACRRQTNQPKYIQHQVGRRIKKLGANHDEVPTSYAARIHLFPPPLSLVLAVCCLPSDRSNKKQHRQGRIHTLCLTRPLYLRAALQPAPPATPLPPICINTAVVTDYSRQASTRLPTNAQTTSVHAVSPHITSLPRTRISRIRTYSKQR